MKSASYWIKLLLLFAELMIAMGLYVVAIFVYVSLSSQPIIFVASCYLAVIISIGLGVIFKLFFNQVFDFFSLTIMSLLCAMTILIFAVFGPVFIDRSISYHIVFYAVEQGSLNINQMEQAASHAIFSKRIADAQQAGFITLNVDGNYSPTVKAKLFNAFMMRLGRWTHSLDNYTLMRDQINDDKSAEE